MLRTRFAVAGLLGIFTSAACYHATVETGLTPGPQTVEKGFAAAWISGLIPPSTVSTAAQCQSGVARVETQLSFLNMLVGSLTLGIFTPMSIKVTCAAAAGGSDSAENRFTVPPLASPEVLRAKLDSAAAIAARTRQPSYVAFSR